MAPVDRHPIGEVEAGDEVLVDVLPVQVGAADRAAVNVRPIDVASVDRDAGGVRVAGDETLVHVLPVQIGAADAAVKVRPVNVAPVHSHSKGASGAGDEALVHVLPVEVGAAYRAGVCAVGPVHVAARSPAPDERDTRCGEFLPAIGGQRGSKLARARRIELDNDTARLTGSKTRRAARVTGNGKHGRARDADRQRGAGRATVIG